jgi:hypothetical protein
VNERHNFNIDSSDSNSSTDKKQLVESYSVDSDQDELKSQIYLSSGSVSQEVINFCTEEWKQKPAKRVEGFTQI